MTTTPTRRTLLRTAAWTAPVIGIAAAAPAFAASTVTCTPTGCKYPGDGPHTKDYVVSTNCATGQPITDVRIDGKPATRIDAGHWRLANQTDSEAWLPVKVTTTDGGTWSGTVQFKPCSQ